MILFNEQSGADFDRSRKYRFALWRIWDENKPYVMFIGLNPSTANETEADPTIKRVCQIAKNNGYGGVYMMNCFPLVSTNPDVLPEFYTSGNPHTQYQHTKNIHVLAEFAKLCKVVVFAWGNFEIVRQTKMDIRLKEMFHNAKALHINANGSPKHPLYCKADSRLIDFKPQNKAI